MSVYRGEPQRPRKLVPRAPWWRKICGYLRGTYIKMERRALGKGWGFIDRDGKTSYHVQTRGPHS